MLSWFPLFFPLRVRLLHHHHHDVLPAHHLSGAAVIGTVILAPQLRATRLRMAPNRPTPNMVRVVCGTVSTSAATAHRGAESGTPAQS
jgi:hypothetical protein